MNFYAKEKNCPRCKKHIDCKANYSGKCIALNDTDFGNRDCPFYKFRIEAYNEKEKFDKGELNYEIDMLKGNINRMCVTTDEDELFQVTNYSIIHLTKIAKLCDLRMKELKENVKND